MEDVLTRKDGGIGVSSTAPSYLSLGLWHLFQRIREIHRYDGPVTILDVSEPAIAEQALLLLFISILTFYTCMKLYRKSLSNLSPLYNLEVS